MLVVLPLLGGAWKWRRADYVVVDVVDFVEAIMAPIVPIAGHPYTLQFQSRHLIHPGSLPSSLLQWWNLPFPLSWGCISDCHGFTQRGGQEQTEYIFGLNGVEVTKAECGTYA